MVNRSLALGAKRLIQKIHDGYSSVPFVEGFLTTVPAGSFDLWSWEAIHTTNVGNG